MSEIDLERAKAIAVNLKIIMEKADLTINGLEAFVGVSRPTINRALLMSSNISPNKVNKLAEAFNLKSRELTDKVPVKTRHIPQIEDLIKFKANNKANFTYFISGSKAHNAHAFVRHELLSDPFYREERRMKELKEQLKKSRGYQKEFTDNALEQAIKRIAGENSFFRISRKSPEGKVFYYIVEVAF